METIWDNCFHQAHQLDWFHSDLRASFTFSSHDLSKSSSATCWIFCYRVLVLEFFFALSSHRRDFVCSFLMTRLTNIIDTSASCGADLWPQMQWLLEVQQGIGVLKVRRGRGVLWLGLTVGIRCVVQNCPFRVVELLLWLSSQICHVGFRWHSIMKAEEAHWSLLLVRGTWSPHVFLCMIHKHEFILFPCLLVITTILPWSS